MAALALALHVLMKGSVAVLGGGIAGLTSAFGLSSRGYDVTVIEEAPALGGHWAEEPMIPLFGCYTATWNLLHNLGVAASLRISSHTPLEFLQPNGTRVQYTPLPLPSPLNTLIGTTLFQGLSMRDRWHLLVFLERTWERDPPMPDDLEAHAAEPWLVSIGQSDSARRSIWNPLSRFLLGDDLTGVSASMFMRTLRRHFFTGVRANKIIVPGIDVPACLMKTLTERLRAGRVSFRLRTGCTGFRFTNDRVTAVEIDGREVLSADYYVAALPFARLRGLLPERLVTHYAYFQQLGGLHANSRVTAQFQVACSRRQSSLILLPDRDFHWVMTRPILLDGNEATDVYMVSTGKMNRFPSSDTMVLEMARMDVTAACPSFEGLALLSPRICRTPDTGLSVEPGTQHCRPLQASPFANLFLAGAWTDTGWPATLGSAVVSGDRCAAAIAA
jgi:glycine/D-amino acid oxidase-like deaminating enzyme